VRGTETQDLAPDKPWQVKITRLPKTILTADSVSRGGEPEMNQRKPIDIKTAYAAINILKEGFLLRLPAIKSIFIV